MKNLAILMSISLFALMGLMPVLSADLKSFQEAYQKNSAEILQSFTPQFADLQQQYTKALETMKTTVQNQGNLVKTKAVIAEIDRFQKDKNQPATLNENDLPEIKAFQVAYVKQYAKLETDLTLKLGALTEKYELALDRLQKEMVKAGKLNEATAVSDEWGKAQLAIKVYTDQLATLRNSSATNRTSMVAADPKTFLDAYQKNSDDIHHSSTEKFEDLQQQFKKVVETLKTNADKVWFDRFHNEKNRPSRPKETELPGIKAFQVAYMKQYTKLEMDVIMKLGALTVKHEQDLDRIQKEMVKAGKLDMASAVLAERENAQRAIKGYTHQLAALRDSSATNRTSMVAVTEPPSRSVSVSSSIAADKRDLYLVVDLKGGTDVTNYPVSYLVDEPKSGWTDEYKTDKLVLRRIESGTFDMGSPINEEGREDKEMQHKVTLSKAFYIGVFEVTQRQWELVMGNRPSYFTNATCYYTTLPVEQVSYKDIRGSGDGANWPANNSVDATSFMGRMRARTGKVFDLPTEAQWEYACRAGHDYAHLHKNGAWYNDKNEPDSSGFFRGITHPVGQKKANAWGLYDMIGNVTEWCLDWYGTYPGPVTDPMGAVVGSGWGRVNRGGHCVSAANNCRPASRFATRPNMRHGGDGFRATITLP